MGGRLSAIPLFVGLERLRNDAFQPAAGRSPSSTVLALQKKIPRLLAAGRFIWRRDGLPREGVASTRGRSCPSTPCTSGCKARRWPAKATGRVNPRGLKVPPLFPVGRKFMVRQIEGRIEWGGLGFLGFYPENIIVTY